MDSGARTTCACGIHVCPPGARRPVRGGASRTSAAARIASSRRHQRAGVRISCGAAYTARGATSVCDGELSPFHRVSRGRSPTRRVARSATTFVVSAVPRDSWVVAGGESHDGQPDSWLDASIRRADRARRSSARVSIAEGECRSRARRPSSTTCSSRVVERLPPSALERARPDHRCTDPVAGRRRDARRPRC